MTELGKQWEWAENRDKKFCVRLSLVSAFYISKTESNEFAVRGLADGHSYTFKTMTDYGTAEDYMHELMSRIE